MSAVNYYRRLVKQMIERGDQRLSEESEARKRVRAQVLRASSSKPPVELEAIAKMLEVIAIRNVPLSVQGRVMLENRGPAIEINADMDPIDQRFALAHELCHLILDPVSSREVGRNQRPKTSTAYHSREHLCDVGATEMLLPTDWLEGLFAPGTEVTGVKVLNAADDARVKPDAIITRLVELGLCQERALWLRVDGQACVPYKSIPTWDDSMLARVNLVTETEEIIKACIRHGKPFEGEIALDILGKRESYVGDCVPIDDNRALALFRANLRY